MAICEIQRHNESKLRFEELYRNAYTLVLHKYGQVLYLGVQEAITTQMDAVCERVKAASDERLLAVLCEEYWEHEVVMTLIKDVLMYMDKEFCRRYKLVSVYELGLLLFRDKVVREVSVHARVKALMLDAVRREREGELIDRLRMKEATTLLVHVNVNSLEVYQLDFEGPFLSQTASYYQQEAQRYFAENNCSEYLSKVEGRMLEEEQRCDAYLDHSTKVKVQHCIQQQLIGNYAKALVEEEKSGCVPMMNNGQDEDLRRMYHLFSLLSGQGKVNPVDYIRDSMALLIKQTGTGIVNDKEAGRHPHLFMQQCLAVRHRFTHYVEFSFSNDRQFVRALKESLESFLNSDGRSAHYLSLYVDDLIRTKMKLTSEADIDARLNDVIDLFRYLQDKDVFEEHYKAMLAQRLLAGGSGAVAGEVERSLIGKLKAESGHQFTSRLEGMFKDMELSKQLMASYHQHTTTAHQHSAVSSPSRRGGGVVGTSSPSSSPSFSSSSSSSSPSPSTELTVQVLTTGFWPLPPPIPILLPPLCQSLLSHFSAFYTSVHSGRRLTWHPSQSTAELRCTFDSGRKELLVHGYGMVILLLYNTAESYTFQQLQQLTRIPRFDLARHLLSLAHPSVRLLKKTPNTRLMEDDHSFAYNTAYTSKLYRNKPPLLSKQMIQGALGGVNAASPALGGQGGEMGEGGDLRQGEGDALPPSVVEARKNRVEASVVRIMKARKRMDHTQLMAEVQKQLSGRFAVEAAFCKKRIEALIEREYIARDKDNRRIYHYLA